MERRPSAARLAELGPAVVLRRRQMCRQWEGVGPAARRDRAGRAVLLEEGAVLVAARVVEVAVWTGRIVRLNQRPLGALVRPTLVLLQQGQVPAADRSREVRVRWTVGQAAQPTGRALELHRYRRRWPLALA